MSRFSGYSAAIDYITDKKGAAEYYYAGWFLNS